MIDKIIQDLETAERAYKKNADKARMDNNRHMRNYWDGCSNGVGRAVEIIRFHLNQEEG